MTHWLGFLSVARKLGLLGLLALLMVALPLGLLLQRIGDGIDSAGDQQAAAAPLLQLQRSTQWLQQHRGLGAQWLAGADEARGKLDELRPRLQAQLQSAAAALAQIDEAAAGRCRALGERLATLGIALDQQRLSGPQSFAEHTALVRESMQLGQEIADRQGLSMSPQPAIHHLVLASVFTQPQLGEALAQARGLGSQILARGALQPAERARIAGLVARLDDSTEVFASFTRSFAASPLLDQRLGAQAEATAAKLEQARTMIQRELLDAEQPTLATATYWAELSAALDAQVALSAAAMEALRELLDAQVDALAAERNRTVAGLLALALLAAVLAVLISRSISRPLARAVQFAEAIGAGQLDTRIELDSSRDETGRLLQRLAAMRDNLRERIEAEHAAAQQNLRLGKALDAAQSGVMVADNDNLIVYMNKRVRDILRRSEADLRREYPQFSVDALIGSPFDIFHRSPERSRKVVERLADGRTHRMDITVAGHHFRQHLCLLHDDSGARMGSMVDWTDRTTEVVIEEEVGRIVQAAAQGQLDGRISIEDKEGFIRRLGGNINALLDSTLHGIQEVHGILEALSAGDLSRRSNADLHGVFLSMRDDANHAADRLEAVIGTIQQAAGAIHTAASEIASGNADLSERTEQQAANLEETASSMEELTSTVRQNADASRQARALALSAADVASRGGGEVGQVVATMQAISASSRRIEDIIGVIDGIAFQTNILALNAAVEAARAGDQGRGFAVVASEVRTLAQRSAEAAKEIKTLIAQSTATVADGARLVEHAGATMGDIVGSVARVNELIGDITAATEEQSAGIDTVNTTVIQLDQMTQQNAALVEQASAAARAMEDQAAELADAVSVFKLRRR